MGGLALIRHGRTAGNLRGAYVGRSDEPLCAQGRQEILSRCREGCYPPAARVYCTPLRRTAETAGLIYPGLRPLVVDGLRECDFGEYEGKTYEELKDLPAYHRWLQSGGHAAFPGGEGRAAFCERCREAFVRLVEREPPQEDVALVLHGGVIMALMEAFALPQKDFYDWQPRNGEGYLLRFEPRLWREARKLELIGKLQGRDAV